MGNKLEQVGECNKVFQVEYRHFFFLFVMDVFLDPVFGKSPELCHSVCGNLVLISIDVV